MAEPQPSSAPSSGGGGERVRTLVKQTTLRAGVTFTQSPDAAADWKDFRSGFRHREKLANSASGKGNGWGKVRSHLTTLSSADIMLDKVRLQGPVYKYIRFELTTEQRVRWVLMGFMLSYSFSWLAYWLQYPVAAVGLGLALTGLAGVTSLVSGVAWILDGGWDLNSAWTSPVSPAPLCLGSMAVLGCTIGSYAVASSLQASCAAAVSSFSAVALVIGAAHAAALTTCFVVRNSMLSQKRREEMQVTYDIFAVYAAGMVGVCAVAALLDRFSRMCADWHNLGRLPPACGEYDTDKFVFRLPQQSPVVVTSIDSSGEQSIDDAERNKFEFGVPDQGALQCFSTFPVFSMVAVFFGAAAAVAYLTDVLWIAYVRRWGLPREVVTAEEENKKKKEKNHVGQDGHIDMTGEEDEAASDNDTKVQKLKTLMSSTFLGLVLDLYHALAATGACFLYLYWSYWHEFESPDSLPLWIQLVNYFLTYTFALDFALRLFTSTNKLKNFFKLASLADYAAVTPVMALCFSTVQHVVVVGQSTGYAFLPSMEPFYFLRFLRFMRITRRLLKNFYGASKVILEVYGLTTVVLALIFCSAGTVFALEFTPTDVSTGSEYIHTPLNALYFTIITFSTVGFGDISPVTEQGRVAVMIIVLLSFVILPTKVRALLKEVDKARFEEQFQTRFIVKRGEDQAVVSGDLTASKVEAFAQELFHRDHRLGKSGNLRLALCSPWNLKGRLAAVVMGAQYRKRMTYLRSHTNTTAEEFTRLNSHNARAWFVLVDAACDKPHEADRAAVLRTVAVKKLHPNLKVYAQCCLVPNRMRLLMAGADFVACEQEIKLSLLAQNVLCPGILTLLMNLMHSQAAGGREMLSAKDLKSKTGWMYEYVRGMDHEVYQIRLPSTVVGQKFTLVARLVYEESSSVLLALKQGGGRVRMFPGDDYVLKKGDSGFVISSSDEYVKAMEEWLESWDSEAETQIGLNRMITMQKPAGGLRKMMTMQRQPTSASFRSDADVSVRRGKQQRVNAVHPVVPGSDEGGGGGPVTESYEREGGGGGGGGGGGVEGGTGGGGGGGAEAEAEVEVTTAELEAALLEISTVNTTTNPSRGRVEHEQQEGEEEEEKEEGEGEEEEEEEEELAEPMNISYEPSSFQKARMSRSEATAAAPAKGEGEDSTAGGGGGGAVQKKKKEKTDAEPPGEEEMKMSKWSPGDHQYLPKMGLSQKSLSGASATAVGDDGDDGDDDDDDDDDLGSLPTSPRLNYKISHWQMVHAVKSTASIAIAAMNKSSNMDMKNSSPEDIRVLRVASGIDGHVVIAGAWTSVEHIMTHLRAPHLSYALRVRPVIILNKKPPSRAIWRSVRNFGEMYWVQGDPKVLSDLRRVALQRASAVLLLARHGGGGGGGSGGGGGRGEARRGGGGGDSDDEEWSEGGEDAAGDDGPGGSSSRGSELDTDTVYTYIGMRDVINEDGTQVSIEVLNSDNMMYLDPTDWVPSAREDKSTGHGLYYMSPIYAASRIFIAGALDTLLAQAYYQPHVLQLLQAFILSNISGVDKESQTHLIPLPSKYDQHKYQELFLQMLAQGGMCLGLYRAAGTNGAELPYVVTNPPKDVRMLASDWVIVLCRQDAKCLRAHSFTTSSSTSSADAS